MNWAEEYTRLFDKTYDEITRLKQENSTLKLRIHRANTLLDKCEGWLRILDRQFIGAREAGWAPFIESYEAYHEEMHQVGDWWSWDEEGHKP